MRRLCKVLPMVLLWAGACAGIETPAPSEAASELATDRADDNVLVPVDGTDCSAELNRCYTACQKQKPTPLDGCFETCRQEFESCIRLPQ